MTGSAVGRTSRGRLGAVLTRAPERAGVVARPSDVRLLLLARLAASAVAFWDLGHAPFDTRSVAPETCVVATAGDREALAADAPALRVVHEHRRLRLTLLRAP